MGKSLEAFFNEKLKKIPKFELKPLNEEKLLKEEKQRNKRTQRKLLRLVFKNDLFTFKTYYKSNNPRLLNC